MTDTKIVGTVGSSATQYVQMTKGGRCTSDDIYCVKNLRPDLITYKFQSPIDINTTMCNQVSCSQVAGGINFREYKQHMLRDFSLINTGETAKMTLAKPPSKEASLILGGPLQGVYAFDSVHFHWGENMTSGSEHSLDGSKYAGEIHLIHYNHMYGTYCQAKTHPNGIVIMATLLQESNTTNANLEAVVNNLRRVRTKNSKAVINTPLPISALLPSSTSKYFMYRGSLTTCPYFETVVWVVFSEPLLVSRRQMMKFHSLRDGPTGTSRPIVANLRESQPLFTRSVDWINC